MTYSTDKGINSGRIRDFNLGGVHESSGRWPRGVLGWSISAPLEMLRPRGWNGEGKRALLPNRLRD